MASSLGLPFELTEEVLSAIPIEYLLQLHLICKQWHSLLKNKQFIYNYLNLTQERFIRLDNNKIQIIDPVTQTRINSPLPAEFPYRPLISVMVHCDGLVLLKFNNTESERRRLLIWNPILGQIRWIPPTSNVNGHSKSYCFSWGYYYTGDPIVQTEYNKETYGIGFNNVSRDDHKILRFYNPIREDRRHDGDQIEIEIYDLKSNSWKYLKTTSDWSLQLSCKGVSVIGNMYWVAKQRNVSEFFIQSFDFSTETFKPRSNCLPFERHMNDVLALSCFRRDKLCLLHQIAESKEIEVWVSNKVDEEVMSWSKYLSFVSPDLPMFYADQNVANHGFFIDKNGKIRVWYEKRIGEDVSVSVYEISEDGIKKEVERSRFNSSYVFVPSLVPLLQ